MSDRSCLSLWGKLSQRIVVSTSFLFILASHHDAFASNNTTSVSPMTLSSNVPINTKGWSDSPFLSLDGQRLYFMYSRYNFFPIFSGGKPILVGPERAGLHHHDDPSEAFSESDIYVAKKVAGKWGNPEPMPFNDFGGDASGMEAGNGFYFVHTPPNGLPDIYVSYLNNGIWSKASPLSDAINSPYVEDNPHVAPTQDGIWFTSDRPGGYGGKDLYFSQKVNGVWTAPVNLGAKINTSANEDQIWVNSATGEIYFNRDTTIYHAVWRNGEFSDPEKFDIQGCPIVAEISFTADGTTAAFACADTNKHNLVIMTMRRRPEGGWDRPEPVD